MKIIQRDFYLNQLIGVMDIPDIKVITGVRRSGKSKIMDMLHDYLSRNDANIVHIKLNMKEFENLLSGDELYDYVVSRFDENRSNYLLIDEVQMCSGFERVINSLHEEEKFDIYLTGSNAFLLSSDLATLFGGRVFEIKVFPFSFKEYLDYYPSSDIDSSFDDYFKKGGMAGSYLYRNESNASSYVSGVVKTTIVMKDKGYDTKVAQGGANFSGGQRQRLTISRAICRDPEIYLFDDSFSALDYKTDNILRKKLREHVGDSTMCIVGQRISTIRNADKIIVIDNARIVGEGKHDELLKNCSVYREIALSQNLKEVE